MSIEKYTALVMTDPKFTGFTAEEVNTMLSYCKVAEFPKGELIIKEGELGDKLYLVAEGEVGISKEISKQVVFFITTLKKGDLFGEMALISQYPRSANAFAKTDIKLIVMDKQDFEYLKKSHPMLFGKIAWILSRTLAERLYKVEERIKQILQASLTNTLV